MTELEIMSCARELGEGIAQSELYAAFEAAQRGYEADGELQRLVGEFSMQQMALAKEAEKPEPARDALMSAAIERRMAALQSDIMANPRMAAFSEASEQLNGMLGRVNSMIMAALRGDELGGGCSPDGCEGCSGCGGK